MDISLLCDKIKLQPEIKSRVLAFAGEFDLAVLDEYRKANLVYTGMDEALSRCREKLGTDEDGVKILAFMLNAAAEAHEIYREKGIDDEIYFATMACFPRYIGETYERTGRLSFDRWWWTTRQAGCHLFRIGELEYELKRMENGTVIGMHIPSDADLSPKAVEKSLIAAHSFFAGYYPETAAAEYRCHSWLMDRQLEALLPAASNIVAFQKRFEIFDKGEANNEFIQWAFNTYSEDYSTLPENTSLQRKLKAHLLSGGVIRNAYGRLKTRA